MLLSDPNDPERKGTQNQTLDVILNVIGIFFIFEAMAKIITMGFYQHKNAYLRDGWNIMDFVIVLTNIVEMISIVSGANGTSFKIFRTMRVLRPLRSVKRVPSMRRQVTIMLRALPELVNTFFFMVFFFLVFGIFGV